MTGYKGIGLEGMEHFEKLPLLRDGVRVQYEGSIDKQGANADWDWWLYRDGQGEWVLLDVEGPGCIYNFVQHRYPTSEEPEFKFYFDGESDPRFTIRHSEFGMKHPFIRPLADQYIGPEDYGRGPIRVVRSFVPMPFRKACRITSSVKLEGFSKDKGDGGWGHVVYHVYDTEDGVETFTGKEDFSRLIRTWKNIGSDPKGTEGNRAFHTGPIVLQPGQSKILLQKEGKGSVAAVRWSLERYDRSMLHDLWIRIWWDGHAKPDVECPAGVFFGNELGYNNVRLLSHGMSTGGELYNFFPMPYWKSARMEVCNRGKEEIGIYSCRIDVKPPEAMDYPEGAAGHFRAAPYYRRKATPGSDSLIGYAGGRGHMVSAQVTAYAEKPGIVSCEGDVRVHIDGAATPQVESDGSESWVCYGWGFPTPPETNPVSGYDGLPDNPWSMVRLCLGDAYPFRTGLRFGIEAGECNDQVLEHSGILFYYGTEEEGMALSDEIDIGNPESEEAHGYRAEGDVRRRTLTAYYEGDDDHAAIPDTGVSFTGFSEFTAALLPGNRGVRLRRRSDQQKGRQKAKVFIDGNPVTERNWYYADRNPYKRWLEDEFEIPEKYVTGKDSIHVRIVPETDGSGYCWNEYRYWVYCMT